MTSAKRTQRPGVRPVDVALGIGVAVMAALGTAEFNEQPLEPVAYVLLAIGGLAVIVHRQWPLSAFAIALATNLSYLLLGHPEGLEWLATAVTLGGVALALGWRWAVPLALLCLLLSLSDVGERGLAAVDSETVLVLVGLGSAVAIGMSLRTRRAYLQAVEERAALIERSRADEARRLVGEERLRIARDVHDVVAHAIASISVQAGVGEHMAAQAPDRARDALAAIRQASSTALDDLRSVLAMLRVEDGTGESSPGGLDDLDRLAAAGRQAGLDVHVTVHGERVPLPSPIDRAAHRIVQEAVTNTIKHAGATRLDVVVTYRPSALDVSVTDDGAGPPTGAVVDGNGLVGMRERVEVLGGRLHVGSGEGGGFRVDACLPLRRGGR